MAYTSASGPMERRKPKGIRKLRDGWLHLTSSGWDRLAITWQQRDALRRSRLASWIILCLLLGDLVSAPVGIDDPHSMAGIIIVAFGAILAAIFNRLGFITAAGLLLTGITVGALLFTITPENLSQPPNSVDLDALPVYDLMVLGVLFAASLINPKAGFWMAGINIVAITLDFTLQPHANDVQHEVAYLYGGDTLQTTLALLARPAAFQVIVAGVAFLWVRGLNQAGIRADLAEQELVLRERYAALESQQREIIQSFLNQVTLAATHLANGQAPQEISFPPDQPLAKIAPFFNALFNQFYKLKQQRKWEDTRLPAAIAHLTETLQQVTSAPPPSRLWYEMLHPYRYKSDMAEMKAIADLIFQLLYTQLEYAYTVANARSVG